MSQHNEFSTFDYSTIQGIPEQRLRVQLLEKRLQKLAYNHNVHVLEIGVGSGDVTLMLRSKFHSVTCVDSSKENCDRVKALVESQNTGEVAIITGRIEDADLPHLHYHHIILFNMLEHLEAPVAILKQLRKHLAVNGVIHIMVPLANSIHRWLGVKMGIICDVKDLAESDIKFGHYRVYTPGLLNEQIELSGLRSTYTLPFYLKPLPTAILTPLPAELHQALFELGQQFPQFASYIYIEAIPE